jgi:hypothetical protein
VLHIKIQRHTRRSVGPIPVSVHKWEFFFQKTWAATKIKIKNNKRKRLSTITKNLGAERLPKITDQIHKVRQ